VAPMRRRLVPAILACGALIAAACSAGGAERSVQVRGSGSTSTSSSSSTTSSTGATSTSTTGASSTTTTTAPTPGAPLSIVQLGDSIASGEGTLYGYTYDQSSMDWTGGDINVTWPGPYPLCHDSPDAYGNLVATHLGTPDFLQLACTGATFAAGITTPELDDGTQMSPAQFGNWDDMTDLNEMYDAANPDLVMITLGADDVKFVDIVEACIKNGYEYYFDLADLECTSSNPGSTIENDFTDFLPTLTKNYKTLLTWIEERAQTNDAPMPKVVVTNYPDPLPPNGAKCPDTSWLYPKQTRYLSSLVGQMNDTIESALPTGSSDVLLADISQAYTPQGSSHIWCTDDPWAYGLSIYHVTDPDSFDSQAPFHPTPDGQESIAEHVIPVVRQLFSG
jgi:lysophospholipase L1-like esterase